MVGADGGFSSESVNQPFFLVFSSSGFSFAYKISKKARWLSALSRVIS